MADGSEQLYGSVAPLRNVSALATLIKRVQDRTHGLPGMAVFYGPSGFGKTTSAIYAANKFDAAHVEVRSVWTSKKLLQAILAELSVVPKRTVADMLDQAAAALAVAARPLIIDEADHLVRRNMIEIARDLHEASGAPVIMIGEELLPQRLQRWERVHGRILDWVEAQPACLDDVERLATIYAPGVDFEEAYLSALLDASGNSIRRVSVNLERAEEVAKRAGTNRMTLAAWAGHEFFRGAAPSPRRGIA
ncbi:MAG: ATP-binding protein [Pseudomonadota bacterium]